MITKCERLLEHRKLSRDEVNRLIEESVPSETKFLRDLNRDIYDFFRDYSVIQDGILVDGRPIYIAALIKGKGGKLQFWTVVNKDTNAIISMTRIVKDALRDWVKKFGILYATMEKVSPKNMKWVQWLGFKPIEENEQYITYRIGE